MNAGTVVAREEYLAWCKARALQYVDAGQLSQAIASMASDMRKHPETRDHAALERMIMLQMGGHLSTSGEVREFIEGFN